MIHAPPCPALQCMSNNCDICSRSISRIGSIGTHKMGNTLIINITCILASTIRSSINSRIKHISIVAALQFKANPYNI